MIGRLSSWRFLIWIISLGVLATLFIVVSNGVFLPEQRLQVEQDAILQDMDHAITFAETEKKLRQESDREHRRFWAHIRALRRSLATLAEMVDSSSLAIAGKDPSKLGAAELQELAMSKVQRDLEMADAAEATQSSEDEAVAATRARGADASVSEAVTTEAPAEKKRKKGPRDGKKKAKEVVIKWRDDFRCGPGDLGPHGGHAECNPKQDPCCSDTGWCGKSHEHCACAGCVDFSVGHGERWSAPPVEGPRRGVYDVNQPKAIALVVPFRDRGVHLELFYSTLHDHVQAWNARGIYHAWTVFIVEQYDNSLFNRGYLFNAGFVMAQEWAAREGREFDCIVMHDVDILPTPVADYGWCVWPNQIAGEIDCWGNSVPYPASVGGVVSMSPAHWKQINGFSNEYEGWGGEDDDLYHRLRIHSLLRAVDCHTFCNVAGRQAMIYRPPLGQGRFTCNHDGHHTPRKRADNDRGMWGRLKEMEGGSNRWRNDGITTVELFEAGPRLQASACNETPCTTPEDPEPKLRLLAEEWARISRQKIPSAGRVHVVLDTCPTQSRALTSIPPGIAELQLLVKQLYPVSEGAVAGCSLAANSATNSNFLLMDVTRGVVWAVGPHLPPVIADSALPAVRETDGDLRTAVEARRTKIEKEFIEWNMLMQNQRWSKWMRQLPSTHSGVLVVTQKPFVELRQPFVDFGQVKHQATPVCISTADLRDGRQKMRLTPGTTWCGNAGWNSKDTFLMLYSASTVREEDRVPLCISFSRNNYIYRFDNSEYGCALHGWEHEWTIYTTKMADGPMMCVGVQAGAEPVWFIEKAANCGGGGKTHQFSFNAMREEEAPKPFVRVCILVFNAASRLAVGESCDRPGKRWKVETRFWLPRVPKADTQDRRICIAKFTPDADGKANKRYRAFEGDFCTGSSSARIVEGRELFWHISQEPLYVPHSATGELWCHCESKADPPEIGNFTWSRAACSVGVQMFCIHAASSVDLLRYVHMYDEVL